MKISEVQQRLDEIKAVHGDIHVLGIRQPALTDPVFMPTAIERVQHWSVNNGWALIIFQPGPPL